MSIFGFAVNALLVYHPGENYVGRRELREDLVRLFEKLKEYLLYMLRTPEGTGAFKVESRIELRISHTIDNEFWPFYFYR